MEKKKNRKLTINSTKNKKTSPLYQNEKIPRVSILVTTYNRKNLLLRCIKKILFQTFDDFELIIIDDGSTDGSKQAVEKIKDSRIKYIYNEINQGAINGDRVHLKRFVYDLCKGKYFVYVCDDDYWLSEHLLGTQVDLMEANPNASMVAGGQLSCFLEGNKKSPDIVLKAGFTKNYENLVNQHIKKNSNLVNLTAKLPGGVFSSNDFLTEFSTKPFEYNFLTGATLFNTRIFKKSKTFDNVNGSKWQAGYELKLGPGSFGSYIYLNYPCLFGEIRSTNASFNRTQYEHYIDCISGVKIGMDYPIKFFNTKKDKKYQKFLKLCKKTTIRNIGRNYLRADVHIKTYGELSLCTEENMSKTVKPFDVFIQNLKTGSGIDYINMLYFFIQLFPKKILKKIHKDRQKYNFLFRYLEYQEKPVYFNAKLKGTLSQFRENFLIILIKIFGRTLLSLFIKILKVSIFLLMLILLHYLLHYYE